ncbi:hypothetical protein C8J56DRAFT_891912 [Mycena floridula]|nr:hypothetical protein C8J56DRAFT_891912 [Mycena floridula]
MNKEHSSFPREASREGKLGREAVQVRQEGNRTPTAKRHRKSTSTSMSSTDTAAELVIGSFLFRASAAAPPSSILPPSSPNRSEMSARRRPLQDSSAHEQILRSRLDRVLSACQEHHDEGMKRASTMKETRRKRTSMPASAPAGAFGWLWQDDEVDEQVPVPKSADLSRSRTASSRIPVPVKTSGPNRKRISLPNAASSLPSSSLPSSLRPVSPPLYRQGWSNGEVSRTQLEWSASQNPPRTRTSSLESQGYLNHLPAAAAPSLTVPPQSPAVPPSPTFDVRTASRQCKLIEGYVSFAAVEGLGCPCDEGEPQSCEQGWKKWLPGWSN